MNGLTTIELELAKNAFQVHGVDLRAKRLCAGSCDVARFCRSLRQLACLVGIEACATSHYSAGDREVWA